MIYKSIDIWNGYEYLSEMNDGFRPTLDTYILNLNTFDGRITDRKRGAIIICPGGGYEYVSEREAEPIAMKFSAEGFHTFILNYSTSPRKHPQPILDLARAMCIIRENADKWLIDKDNICICGFSAGAHLAATLGVYWNKNFIPETNGVIKELIKPNGLILCYPVITAGEYCHGISFEYLLGKDATDEQLKEMSLECHVDSDTPNTFLWHTIEDLDVPVENSLCFANALRKYNIPFEMHIFPNGGHGLALANEETTMPQMPLRQHVSNWMPLAIQWLKKTL